MRLPSWKLTAGVACVCTLLAVGGGYAWRKQFRDQFVPRNFGVVVDGAIYRSGRLTATTLRALHEEHHFRTIIDLSANEPQNHGDVDDIAVASELGLTRYAFTLTGDGTGDPNIYVETVRIMADPARQPVLVHCGSGAQRTTGAVVLYRHLVEGRSILEAYPESFEFKHDPDDYRVLAYLADHIEAIRDSYETGRRLVLDRDGHWMLAPAMAAKPEARADGPDTASE